jgi:hypothetical protein
MDMDVLDRDPLRAFMVLLAPAGIAREGMLIHFRLASIPFLGEIIMQPSG